MTQIDRQISFWAHMLDEAFQKHAFNEEESIADNDVYLANMAKSFSDKAWFLKYIPEDIDTIVDFGGGTGEFASYCQKRMPNLKYAVVDNNQSFLSQASKAGFITASSLSELRDSRAIDFSKALLILSSVIHEVYSYADPFYDDVGTFWSDVKKCRFKCIALRDMSYDEKAMRNAPVDAILWVYKNIFKSSSIKYKGIPFKDITNSFEDVWGAICDVKLHKVNSKNLMHFLIKYRYQENWAREVEENYLPVSQEKLAKWLTSFMSYTFMHKESSKLEFYHDCWAKDFKLKRPDNRGYAKQFLSWLKTLNTHIKWFLERNASIKLNESHQQLKFIHDVPENVFKQVISNAKITNKHFDVQQFEKLYGQDYKWCILLDNDECVAAAAMLKGFGPKTDFNYVNELQSLRSQHGYGKELLLKLQDFYKNLWLMADASVKSDVLLKFYRYPAFNFIEHVLPAYESKYDVDTHVFAPESNVSEQQWHKFLKQYFGNENAVKSLLESSDVESSMQKAFSKVVNAYMKKFGIDLSYMKFKVDSQPVYTNGEPCYEYDLDECAGDWTSLRWIRLNPNMKSVMKRYGIKHMSDADVQDFTERIIAHELAHEVWNNNIVNDNFKKDIIAQAYQARFSTPYLKTVEPNDIDVETFCEWMSNCIVNEDGDVQNAKDISFPDEEIPSLQDKRHIVTHRVSNDLSRFNIGDKVMSPWEIPYEVTSKIVIDDVDESPYVDQLIDQQKNFLKDFDKIAVLELDAVYEPPYSLEQIKANYPKKVFQKLLNDPVHRWRAETGIELIHHEPDEKEQDRMWRNWQLMPQKLKDISDKKSLEIFGCTNAKHYKQLKRQWALNLNENRQTYLQKYKDEVDVNDVVDMFWIIRQRLKAPQNDIDWWIKKPFQALKDFVQSYDPLNKRQRRDAEYRREMVDNDAKMLGSKDGYEIWYVPTYEAMRTIGRFYKGISTAWCVASDDPSFWFDMHDMSEFIVLVRENPQNDEFDKIAIEMQNGGRRFDVDEFVMWDAENEDDRFCNDDLMHYAWELFVQNGERRRGI